MRNAVTAHSLQVGVKRHRRKATELLDEFDLTEAADKPLKNFSGGLRRRPDQSASLISMPLLVLDEPTTGLDPCTRAQMWETIRRLVRDHRVTVGLDERKGKLSSNSVQSKTSSELTSKIAS